MKAIIGLEVKYNIQVFGSTIELSLVLFCCSNVNLISDIRIIERNADVLLNSCKDIGLAVHIGKTKYMQNRTSSRHDSK